MNKVFTLILSTLILSSWVSCDDPLTKSEEKVKKELIYIQQAKGAELSVCKERLGHYLLTIKGNDKTLVYFSDKPDRLAGTLTLAQFVKKWDASAQMHEDFPNAIISYVSFKAENEDGVGPDILQLSEPKYDASTDTITFLAKPLHEYEVMTGKFENIVIVYDGIDLEDGN